ncbi:hypothetical protein [Paenirhodobacter populi]|uniref:hypothetical protein n=1 Tax=Paenirhodobacter populi TaxID=2306993 RepID=UPI0013E36FFD|nr:hypothetical protein [Sinirhodobacter populi]
MPSAHALVGERPVVTIRNGRVWIAEFGYVLDGLDRHEALRQGQMTGLGQIWHQRRD